MNALRRSHPVRSMVFALALGTCGAVLSPNTAFAQSAEEIAGARALAKQGIEAHRAGDFKKAYDLLARAESLYHAPIHQLYMARAADKLGRLVEARELYNKVIREQLADDAPEAFRQAQTEAAEEIAQVEPRLAQVSVVLEGDNQDQVEVHTRGKAIPAALIGAPRPMDPGNYTFTVVSDVMEAKSVEVQLKEGQSQTVTLQLVPKTTKETSTGISATPEDGGTGSAVPAYVALGVGGLGAILGTVFLVDHLKKKGDADELFEDGDCGTDGQCTTAEQEEIQDLSSKAATAGTLSVVGYGIGAVGIGVGVTLLLLPNKKGEDTAHYYENNAHIRPLVGWSSIGVSGRF